jgi:HSP20 family molecular chaperone IbpA
LFEARGREHGHDREDWFRARSELLHPASVPLSESEDRTSIRADVVGFDETELEVSVEPSCITIVGKKRTSGTKTERGTTEKTGSPPNQILEVVDLATEVIPEHAVVELQSGVLRFELPAAAKKRIKTAA